MLTLHQLISFKSIDSSFYSRVSTDKDEQLLSLKAQKEFFAEYAEKMGYELIGLYADEGISGTKLKNRKQFNRMMERRRIFLKPPEDLET